MVIEYRFALLEVRAADGGQIEGTAMPYGREADIAGMPSGSPWTPERSGRSTM